MKMKKIFTIFAVILITFYCNSNAHDNVNIKYEADVLPQNATQPWTTSCDENASVTNSVLVINTIGTTCNEICGEKTFKISDIVNKEKGVVIVAKVKVGAIGREGESTDIAIIIADSEKSFFLGFLEDKIIEGNVENINSYSMQTTDDYHLYRIEYKNGIANVYVDGVHRLTLNGYSSDNNYIAFGDVWQTCRGMNGLTYWDYIHISDYETDCSDEFQTGRQECINNPNSCNISIKSLGGYTQDELNSSIAEAISKVVAEKNEIISSMKTQDELIQAVDNAISEKQKKIDELEIQISNMFSKDELNDAVSNAKKGLYNQEQVDTIINKILEWDNNNDGVIGLIEAIHALQTTTGVTPLD